MGYDYGDDDDFFADDFDEAEALSDEPSFGQRLLALDPRIVVPVVAVVGLVVIMGGILLSLLLFSGGGPGGGDNQVVEITPPPDTATATPSRTATSTQLPTITPLPSDTSEPTPTLIAPGAEEPGAEGEGEGGGGEAVELPPLGDANMDEITGFVQVRYVGEEIFRQVLRDVVLTEGDTILTGEKSSAKLLLPDGTVVRVGSQTQITLDTLNSELVRLELDFGKAWHVVRYNAPFETAEGYVYEIAMPEGLAYSSGTYISTEYNTTARLGVVTCLYTTRECAYATDAGQVLMAELEQAQSLNGEAPDGPGVISDYQLAEWLANVPEVEALTPTATSTATSTGTGTRTPTRTPNLTETLIARTERARLTDEALTATEQIRQENVTGTAQVIGTERALTATNSDASTQVVFTREAQQTATADAKIIQTQEAQSTSAVQTQQAQNTQTAIANTQGATATQQAGTQAATQTQQAATQTAAASINVTFDSATVSVNENVGTINLAVRLLNAPTTDQGTIRVNYQTTNGTATGADYTPEVGAIDFVWGGTSYPAQVNITVDITNDSDAESDETFNVEMTAATNPGGSLNVNLGANPNMTVTIIDDDTPIQASVATATDSVAEDGGTIQVLFRLNAAAPQPITLNYSFNGGTASAGTDFQTPTGSVVFNTNDTEKSFTLNINDDSAVEGNETVVIQITSVSFGAIDVANDTTTVTIIDNDLTVQFNPTTASDNEGATGVTVVAQLNGAVPVGSGPFTVDFTVTDNTAARYTTPGVNCPGSPTISQDYIVTTNNNAGNGTLTFNPGDTQQTISFNLCDDIGDEADTETFNATLSNPSPGLTLGGATVATVTINDNEQPPQIDFTTNPYPSAGGNISESAGTASVPIALYDPTTGSQTTSGNTITVTCTTEDVTAVSPGDFTATNTVVTFNPGDATRTCDVPLNNDGLDEDDVQTFRVRLSNPNGGTLRNNNNPAEVRIGDDDVEPNVGFPQASYTAPVGGDVTVTISLSGASERDVTVTYSTVDGTAVAGVDFDAITNFNRTINAGSTTVTFTVNILGGATSGRSFTVVISGATNANVVNNTTTITIVP